jgi:lysophospholipid acyltransferase (LPLAT)-like uncharacterized protein
LRNGRDERSVDVLRPSRRTASGEVFTVIPALKVFLLRPAVAALADTTHIVSFEGRDRLEALLSSPRPVILCLWHNQLLYASRFVETHLVRRGFKLAMMASLSRDGEVGARMGAKIGVRVVRGSQARQGAQGLRALYRAVAKEGYSIIILPDGSRGPVYIAKHGAIMLAKMTGAPLVPMACSPGSFWEAGSWDRMVIPKPFSRMAIAVDEAIEVPAQCGDEQVEALRVQLEESLNRLTAETRKRARA